MAEMIPRCSSTMYFANSARDFAFIALDRRHRVIGRNKGGFLPYVFTQEGIAMLSSVLRSPRAVRINIDIMRAFVRLRQMLEQNKDIAERVGKLELGHDDTSSVIAVLVQDIDRVEREVKHMKALPPSPKREIGFRLGDDD